MINSHNVEARLPHQCQIGIDLFRPADIISFCIRFERSVRDAFNKNFRSPSKKNFALVGLAEFAFTAEFSLSTGSKIEIPDLPNQI